MQRSLIYLAEQTETLRAGVAQRAAVKKDKASPASTDASLQALASLCQALLGSNRFLYLD